MENPTDLEVVISPLKDMLKGKAPCDMIDDRGGRRGKHIKSRLGPRPEATLQTRKKITRSPFRANNPRKRQAVSFEESPKKGHVDNNLKRAHGSFPLPPTVGSAMEKTRRKKKGWWLTRSHRQTHYDPKLESILIKIAF